MLLQLGDSIIADSDTDEVTQTLKVSPLQLTLAPDSIKIRGSKWTRQIARHGASLSITVTIGRAFKNYFEAERFAQKHIAILNGLSEGDLKLKTMLGDVFVYSNAVLNGASVANDAGVWTEMDYSFICGAPYTTFICSVCGYAVKVGDYHITINS